ncbi:hypothetical protein EV195_10513 [Tenacibaculum skagerrakense]|uniref:Uncharacterized protein n=1 Tax=Tenacibaculum skagerrakense TaxID=186571 RepID=A0A4R2NS45_9FLAO|nr:hypothetical protein EV195_10513 [Tenacibaculum skagerrakense]
MKTIINFFSHLLDKAFSYSEKLSDFVKIWIFGFIVLIGGFWLLKSFFLLLFSLFK